MNSVRDRLEEIFIELTSPSYENRMSISQLCDRTAIDGRGRVRDSTISAFRNGKGGINVETLEKILDALPEDLRIKFWLGSAIDQIPLNFVPVLLNQLGTRLCEEQRMYPDSTHKHGLHDKVPVLK